jgi:hypothetical protein
MKLIDSSPSPSCDPHTVWLTLSYCFANITIKRTQGMVLRKILEIRIKQDKMLFKKIILLKGTLA